jgi:hypothetical protein
MTYRRFVLHTAAEIAPQMVHPGTRTTISDLYTHLDHPQQYIALTGGSCEQRNELTEHIGRQFSAPVIRETNLPTGLNEGGAIEFLKQHAELLSPNNVVADGQLRISDFYFDDLRHPLNDHWQPDVAETWEHLRQQVVPPKLLAVIREEDSQQSLPTPWPCPIVQLSSQDPAWAIEELSAAILAMQ